VRKRLIASPEGDHAASAAEWIDVERCARVELTSEDSAYPIESALRVTDERGWRALEPGPQRIRFLFDRPTCIRGIHLVFHENEIGRTQEFSLHCTSEEGATREILRQQYTFSPPTTTCEVEDYEVTLAGVDSIELRLIPDINGNDVHASLSRWLLTC
jgi:hypothetical protein